jgi:hypothetical protein
VLPIGTFCTFFLAQSLHIMVLLTCLPKDIRHVQSHTECCRHKAFTNVAACSHLFYVCPRVLDAQMAGRSRPFTGVPPDGDDVLRIALFSAPRRQRAPSASMEIAVFSTVPLPSIALSYLHNPAEQQCWVPHNLPQEIARFKHTKQNALHGIIHF